MKFKTAAKEDFDIAYDYIVKLWDYNTYNKDQLRPVYEEVIDDENAFAFFLQDENESYHGFCHGNYFHTFWMSGMTCYLSSIITNPEDRGKGYGVMLMDRAAELAKERGCKAIMLMSGLPRETAHAFYEKYGFDRGCYGFDYYL